MPPHPDQKGWVDEAKALQEIYRLVPKAIEDPSFARSQPMPLMKQLLQIRAAALARAGRVSEAVEAAKELRSLPDDPEGPLNVGRVYALIVRSLANEKPEVRAPYVAAAVESLAAAVRANPSLVQRLEYDQFLESIRDEPSFRSLLAH